MKYHDFGDWDEMDLIDSELIMAPNIGTWLKFTRREKKGIPILNHKL